MAEERSDMSRDQLLNSAADIAVLLLENGGEIYRVEDSVQRIFRAYGVAGCQVFVIPSLIIISFTDGEGHSHSQIRRMSAQSTDLSRVGAANDLCRRVCRDCPGYGQIQRDLEACRRLPVWPLWAQALACGLVGFSFTFIFGGNWWDSVGASLCGLAIFPVRHMMIRLRTNTFFVHLAASFAAAVTALLLRFWGLGQNLDLMIIGALMNLVPGLALTSFMRDIIAGDLLAGIIRFIESFLIGAAIALGSGFALTLLRPVLGG